MRLPFRPFLGRPANKKRATRLRLPRSRTPRFELLEDRRMLSLGAIPATEPDSRTADTTFFVSTLIDEDDGDYGPGDLSLREALSLAAQQPGGDVILFDPSLNGGTITLVLGQLVIDSNVEVLGPGSDQLTIDADGKSRVFCVAEGVIAQISALTITGGNTRGSGGGVYNSGAVTITAAAITDNSTHGDGRGHLQSRHDDDHGLYDLGQRGQQLYARWRNQ